MRWNRTLLCFVLLLGLAFPISATPCKIAKVLPQLLDDQGRHTVSPSLYGRDAYQALLREHPEIGNEIMNKAMDKLGIKRLETAVQPTATAADKKEKAKAK